jgi:D-alanyl-D-alanine carboxypeptidase
MKRNATFEYSGLIALTLIASLLITSCTPVSSTPPPPMPETLVTATPTSVPTMDATQEANLPTAKIDELMNRLIERSPLAGIALGIQFKGTTYVQGYGLANLEIGERVTPRTLFKIASLTKVATAAGIVHLSQEGKLSLDDPISRFLPQTPPIAQDVLVRHLLHHTSGLPDWSMDDAQEALGESFTTDQAVEYYFSMVEKLHAEPGQVWAYNNAGYFLLGAIIEELTGMDYDEYLRHTFFQPLGLPSIHHCPPASNALATGYHVMDGEFTEARPSNLRLLGAAGGLCSNIADLLSWQVALTHGEAIRPELWKQISTPGTLSNGQLLDYGFGVSIQTMDQGVAIMHDGATAGFNSFFIFYPDHDLNIVLLTNTDGFDSHLRAFSSLIVSKLLKAQ